MVRIRGDDAAEQRVLDDVKTQTNFGSAVSELNRATWHSIILVTLMLAKV